MTQPTAMIGGMPMRIIANGDGTYTLATSEAPMSASTAMTVGAPAIAGGRKLFVNASAAGNVTVTLAGGGTLVIAVPVGVSEWAYSVTQITASTATATYASLS